MITLQFSKEGNTKVLWEDKGHEESKGKDSATVGDNDGPARF